MYWNLHMKKGVLCCICMALVFCLCLIMVSGGSGEPAVSTNAKANSDSVTLPIIMYHGMLRDPKMQGEFVISPDLFESDLRYIKEHGYHTVVMRDLIDFVYKGKDLPENPIMITFDDGYYNNYIYAYPLLQKYDCKMVLSPIGFYADQYSKANDLSATYSNASWDNLKEMLLSGYVELQNHSYNMHASNGSRLGTKKKSSETEADYKKALHDDLQKAQERFRDELGVTPTTFTYPFGAISDSSTSVIKELGFQATLTCTSKLNTITKGDKDCLYGLGRLKRTNKGTSETFFKKLG